MSEDWTIAHGSTGEVWASPGGIVVRRQGVRAAIRYGSGGERRIPIEQVTAVQLKPAGIAAGWIRFSVKGDTDARPGSRPPANDPNGMEFSAQQQGEFEAVRAIVDHALGLQRRQPPDTGSASTVVVATEIKRLSHLRDTGVLTEAEFNSQKSQLLGRAR
jgi:hypothetical protein